MGKSEFIAPDLFALINPIRAGGAESACTFFKWLFPHGLEVPNFVTFPNSL